MIRPEWKRKEFQTPELDQTASERYDILSGVECELRFVVKNVENRPFPGGKFSDLSIAWSLHLGSLEHTPTSIIDTAASLLPGEEKPLCPWKFSPRMDGHATIRLKLVANDKDVVNLKIHEGDPARNPIEFPVCIGKPTEIMTIFELRNWHQRKKLLAPRKLLKRLARSL